MIENNEIFEYKVVLSKPDRLNIPNLMHDTCICQLDVNVTNN